MIQNKTTSLFLTINVSPFSLLLPGQPRVLAGSQLSLYFSQQDIDSRQSVAVILMSRHLGLKREVNLEAEEGSSNVNLVT